MHHNLLRDEILLFAPGSEKADQTFEVVKGIDNPRLAEMFPLEIEQLKMEVELVHGASHPFDHDAFLSGMQTPVFFGSAINNFGIREILNALSGKVHFNEKFEDVIVCVAGFEVYVRGRIMNGIPKIGTFFIK